MDYSIGSVAALISGNITPNRPKSLKRALTPTKHQPSPNVTPKSEFVDDRSIFLSPSVQKKKAIIKKSPKRIFQAPDLDVTNDGEGIAALSPKADKVKKHLKDELEATTNSALNTKSPKSPKKKHNKSVEMKSPKKQLNLGNVETSDVVVASGDCTPTKSPKKKKLNKSMEIKSKKELSLGNDETSDLVMASGESTPNKKQKKNRNSISDVKESTDVEEKGNINKDKSPQKKLLVEGDNLEKQDSLQIQVTSEGAKKNKKKRKKSKSKQSISVTANGSTENATDKTDVSADAVINQSPQKGNKKKNKRKKKKSQVQNTNTENEAAEIEPQQNQEETKQTKKTKSQVNPNAITDKDSDSEHESDDEIESEDEHNTKILDAGSAESSDEEEEVSKPKKAKLDQDKDPSDVKTEDDVKRTIFVGNVPFSKKCKKDVKKIFSQHGEIETVRIRTIPVKDARVTPKLAIIKNELHPDRSTVNVYIRFKHPSSVGKALAENNTVLNEHHLRVTRSDSTGADHDPKCTVFVGNVPFAMEDEALRAKFENCGEIDSVRIVRDKKTNAGKGFAYVNFASKDGVELALAMSEEDLTIKNRIMRVKRCTDTTKKDKHGGGQVHQRPHGRGGSVNRGGNFSRGGSSDRGNFSSRGGRGARGGSSDRGSFSGRGGRGARGGGSSDRGNFSGRGARGGGNFNRGGGSSRGGGNFSRGGGNFGRGRGSFGRGGGRGGRFQEDRGGGGRFQGGNERNEGQIGFRANEDPALRRIMNKRQNQDSSDGPPNKKARDTTQPREKKERKEFVGITAEKKKQKRKFDKGQKQKKALSEILTK